MADTNLKTVAIPESVMKAENITYNNENSNLDATNTQDAIDEIAENYKKVGILTDELGEWQIGNVEDYPLKGVAYGNDTWVITSSEGRKYYSKDGVNWTEGSGGKLTTILGLAFGNGKFVAIGYYYDSTSIYSSMYSEDGITWVDGNTNFNDNDNVNLIAYGNGKFVAIYGYGSDKYYSEDGINWTYNGSGNIQYIGLAYGNGKFVAVGKSGSICYSEDGVTWKVCSDNVSSSVEGLAYGNGKFFAFGWEVIWYSEDGITWVDASSNASGLYFAYVFCLKNLFVGVLTDGGIGLNATYSFVTSEDGITWSSGMLSSIDEQIRDCLYADNKVVCVGSCPYYAEYIKEQRNLEEVINELYSLLNQ